MIHHSIARACVLVCVALLGASLATASDGRRFAGYYELGGIEDGGSNVDLTISLQLFNTSRQDIFAAHIILSDSVYRHVEHARFGTLAIPSRRSVIYSHSISIPHHEYEQWMMGAAPRVFLEYPDTTGTLVRHPVELIAGPIDVLEVQGSYLDASVDGLSLIDAPDRRTIMVTVRATPDRNTAAWPAELPPPTTMTSSSRQSRASTGVAA